MKKTEDCIMKKYIILIVALLAVTGCGKKNDSDNTNISTTEAVTEESTETTEGTSEVESEEIFTSDETKIDIDIQDEADAKNNSSEKENDNFESSKTYAALMGLAENAGFDISYENENVVYKTYITDDTVDYIKEKSADYKSKWEETCGLYEEFCSEAVRTVKSNNVTGVNVVLEVLGRSDNQIYFKNENGTSIYDSYVE